MRDRVRERLVTLLLCAGGVALGEYFVHSLGFVRADLGQRHEAQIRTNSLELVDSKGRRRALLAMASEESPALWLFDTDGRARLNLGIYGDGNAFVVLNDSKEQAVEIVRTVGHGEPVLVQKLNGRDKLIMGINEKSGSPYLVTYGSPGGETAVFGRR